MQRGWRATAQRADIFGGKLPRRGSAAALSRARDQQIADHMQQGAFNPAVMNTLRVSLGWSWNAVRWWRDTVKWDWSATDGNGKPSKARRMMAPDSRVPMPEP
eukprot:18305-Prymnesium_polylepis.1